VFVIPPGGGASRQLATDLGRAFNPEWSADGKSVMVTDSHNFPWICPLEADPCRQAATERMGRFTTFPGGPFFGPAVSRNRLIFGLRESTGNVWLADFE
jgi:sugar lactone lactonase YvrE